MATLKSTTPEPEYSTTPEPEYTSTPEPEITSTPEPETITKILVNLISTPEPESSTPEPEIFTNFLANFTTAEPEPGKPEFFKSGFEVSPEPEPEFDIAKEVWGAAWPIHVYAFAIIFTLLMFYNLNSILGLARTRRGAIRRKKIFMLTNLLLFFFNFITALHLLMNPYGSHEHFQIKLPGLLFIFFGLRLPCLTAAFSMILITLVETTKVKLYSKKLQNIWYLLSIISVHFIVVISIHFYLVFHQDQFQLIAICQMFYILFGLIVSATVLYCYFRVKQQLNREEEHLLKIVYRSFRFSKGKRRRKKEEGAEGVELENKDTKEPAEQSEKIELIRPRSPFVDRSLRRLFRIAVLVSVSGLTYCVAVLYSMSTMLANDNIIMQPWPWLIYQTLSRIAEIGMVVGMSYLVRRSIVTCCGLVVDERTRSATNTTLSNSKI